VFSSKHCTIMGKNRTTLTSCRIQRNLLRGERPETILAKNFDVANENAAIYTNPQDFAASLKAAVAKMILKGFRTFKAGSCFADLAATRAAHASQRSDEHFFRTEAIVVPVLIEGDTEGAAAETQAINLPRMVNVRKIENRSSNEPWSAARPGIVYIVPTRSETVAAFKSNHLSRYKKIQMKLPTKSAVPRNRKPCNMKKKPRKKRSDSGIQKTYPIFGRLY
jgi:hypothetical protein